MGKAKTLSLMELRALGSSIRMLKYILSELKLYKGEIRGEWKQDQSESNICSCVWCEIL